MKAAVAVLFIATVTAYEVNIPLGSPWRYHDLGVSLDADGWTSRSYDDSAWAEGPGHLGYGDNDETTVVSFGTNKNNKHPSYYFRHSFDLDVDPSTLTAAVVGGLADDGIVVYINGVEIGRRNMPDEAIPTYETFSPEAAAGNDENAIEYFSFNPNELLAQGPNVVAIMVKQSDARSSDMSFDALIRLSDEISVAWLEGAPIVTPTTDQEVVASWKTNVATESMAWFSVSVGVPFTSARTVRAVTDTTTEHHVALGGLQRDRFYSLQLGYNSANLGGVDVLLSNNGGFRTLTDDDTTVLEPTRFLIVGDIGDDTAVAASVIDAYTAIATNEDNHARHLISLGNAAYTTGSDADIRAAMAPLRNLFANINTWPVFGNVDETSSDDDAQTGPYFETWWALPTFTSGVPSGHEAYYSFEVGAVHVIVLSSLASDRTSTGPMATWLAADLAAVATSGTAKWMIAAFHHPAYTNGHDRSDSNSHSTDMRITFVPMLEAAGVDLVLSAHTRAYERSVLLDGFTGDSSTYSAATHAVDASLTGPYAKAAGGNNGAVYLNIGSSGGVAEPATLNFPSTAVSSKNPGSVVLDVTDTSLGVRFITSTGAVEDDFVIYRGTAPTDPSPAASPSSAASAVPTTTAIPPSFSSSPLPTPSNSPSISITPTISVTPSNSPAPSTTPTQSPTPPTTPTQTPAPSTTPTASTSAPPSTTATATVSPSVSAAPSTTPTATPSISITPTPTLSPGASASNTASNSPAPSTTPTSSETPSVTATPTISETPSATGSPAASPSATPSTGASTTPTATTSPPPSESSSPAATPAASSSPGASPDVSSSPAPNINGDPSSTPTATPAASVSPTPSATTPGGDGSCVCSCTNLACCGNVAQDIINMCSSDGNTDGSTATTTTSNDSESRFSSGTLVATALVIVGAAIFSGVVLYVVNRVRGEKPRAANRGAPVDVVVGSPGASMRPNPTYRHQEGAGLLGAGASGPGHTDGQALVLDSSEEEL